MLRPLPGRFAEVATESDFISRRRRIRQVYFNHMTRTATRRTLASCRWSMLAVRQNARSKDGRPAGQWVSGGGGALERVHSDVRLVEEYISPVTGA